MSAPMSIASQRFCPWRYACAGLGGRMLFGSPRVPNLDALAESARCFEFATGCNPRSTANAARQTYFDRHGVRTPLAP